MNELSRRNRQLAVARSKAVARRKGRAKIRADLKEGLLDPVKLCEGFYESREPDIAGWRLEQLLHILPGVGSATASEIYSVGPFSPRQLVSSLNPDRRKRLGKLVNQGVRRK